MPHDPDVVIAELERNLVEVARALFASATVEGALRPTVDLAVAAIDGCDAAGILVLRDQAVVTTAASDPIAVELDNLQSSSDEGPCLDAARGIASVYATNLAEDDRWPRFGPAAAGAGISSVLALRLSAEPPSALNLYARQAEAFSTADQAKGLLFATLAEIALAAADERAEGLEHVDNLLEALRTRELIGQAQGILIEREHITGDEAFDVLRRASQHMNIKVREVARTLVETGERPVTGDEHPAG